jgi:hypothetical protein
MILNKHLIDLKLENQPKSKILSLLCSFSTNLSFFSQTQELYIEVK